MDYSMDLSKPIAVNFSPSSVAEEILQNVRTICSTVVGSVPLDRDFGMSMDMLDQPINISRMLFQSAVIQALAKYEPRAKLVSIDFSTNGESVNQGITMPRLTLEIQEYICRIFSRGGDCRMSILWRQIRTKLEPR